MPVLIGRKVVLVPLLALSALGAGAALRWWTAPRVQANGWLKTMGIVSAVAGQESEGAPPAAPADLVGTWLSEERQTKDGPMTFLFRFEGDGHLEVIGTPAGPGEEYRRHGPYRLEGGRLVSPALNEGQPIQVALRDGYLTLTIEEALSFRLRRERPARRNGRGPASE